MEILYFISFHFISFHSISFVDVFYFFWINIEHFVAGLLPVTFYTHCHIWFLFSLGFFPQQHTYVCLLLWKKVVIFQFHSIRIYHFSVGTFFCHQQQGLNNLEGNDEIKRIFVWHCMDTKEGHTYTRTQQ